MDGMHSLGIGLGRRLGWMMLALAAAVPAGVHASSLQASPVVIDFDPTAQAEALTLSNAGAEPLEAQVRVQRWSQQDGLDRLEPADDIVATPAIVKIAPGQRQVVRLVRSRASAPPRELSYRELVDQLPTNQHDDGGVGLRVLLRYSIPVFVAAVRAPVVAPGPAGTRPPPPLTDLSAVRAVLGRSASGGTELRVRNAAPVHLRISALGVQSSAGGAREVVPGLVGYVLPGQQMSFPVDLPLPLSAGQLLKARFNDDREAQPVPLDRVGP